jgi:peptidoglycan hydrolase-like protein with peptidoglycan-binding domain
MMTKAILAKWLASGALVAGVAVPASTAAVTATATTSPAALTSRLAADATLTGWPVLRPGPNSTWPQVTVRSLQYLLDAHGAKVAVDGVFGANTEAAVLAFQRAHHLTADGATGPQTWAALIVTVQDGSTGYAVRAVQDQMNYRGSKYGYTLAVDGVFGPTTRLAVLAFQTAGKITADGVVGPVTWHALVNESLVG